MDRISLGSTPVGETCAQVGTEGYWALAQKECRVFIGQLLRHFQTETGKPIPEGCKLVVRSAEHDFGTYHEVYAEFDPDSEKAVNAAYWFEAHQPQEWDEQARQELGLQPDDGAVGWSPDTTYLPNG
jgi:hypothetical protein